ncbi:MAG: tRNA pseudouridine(13) synthase TruD [Candidatus Nanoarchaeia archaeon]
MLLKHSPQDFIVNEIYDLEQLKESKGEGGNYAYFIFTKTNLAQQKAIIFLAQKLQIASKRIHCCGTKDKIAVTTQLISIQQCNKEKAQEFAQIINSQSEDMKLEYVGQFNQRLNLSDNQGNKFEITLRDVSEEEKQQFLTQKQHFNVYNLFQSQRFGVCQNTHKIGLLLIQNNIKDALFEILQSLPQEAQEENNNYIQLCQEIQTHFTQLLQDELREKYKQLQELFPQFLNGYETVLNHLINTPKDVSGALRTIPKKVRTLYIHAFQSAIFNEVILNYVNEHKQKGIELPENVYLIGANMKPQMSGYEKSIEILDRLNLKLEDLQLNHMPELQLFAIEKPLYSQVENYECREVDETTLQLSFKLRVGCYATQVISEIVGDEEIITF